MLIDTHSHLCSEELFCRAGNIVNNFEDDEIEAIVCPSYDIESNKRTLILINEYAQVFGGLGIHPENCDDWNAEVRDFMEKNIDNPKVVAIGEVGLDYHYDNTNRSLQRQILLEQLNISKNANLPVIFHVRDAWDDFFQFIRGNRDLVCSGVVHCFDGDVNRARQLLDLGFQISFTGLITYNKPYLWETVGFVPLDRIMVETDSPYLVPTKAQKFSKINEPKNVQYVVQRIAELKGMHEDKVMDRTTDNAYNFFKKMRLNDE